MKVGLVLPGFSADRSDWCIPALRDLVSQLSAVTDLHVYALRYPYRAASYEVFGARVTALGGAEASGPRSAMLWRRTAASLAAEHRRRPFDVLHAFWAGEPGFLTAVAGRALRIPTVVSLAGGELAGLRDIRYGGLLRRVERLKTRWALKLADAITTGSALALESARPWVSPKKASRFRRIPLGVDLSMFTPAERGMTGGPAMILHVASLSPVKDQATLLSAAAELRDRGYTFQLEIAGTGGLEPQLRALAGCLDIDRHVCWRGAVPHDRLVRDYQRAQVFVLSSRHEAQGMVALEAAASGVPVVGTRVGVIPELAPDAGRLADVGDARGLTDGIAELLDDPIARARAGCRARDRALAEFGLERSAARFHDLYLDVAGWRASNG